MTTFTIDEDKTITAFARPSEALVAANPCNVFSSEAELARMAANWPTSVLVEIWNSFAGVAGFGGDLKPVKKFTDRKTAVARIWTAIQALAPAAPKPTPAPQGAASAPAKTKATRKAKNAKPAPAATTQFREGSKTATVVEMLQRAGGATLPEIMAKMGWQKHTVRGFMAGAMKKAGFTVESFKPEGGERTYRIAK
jgi:hypothetical protein